MLFSVIIPCYNNAESIGPLIERLDATLAKEIFSSVKIQIVFVDDGSSDQTYIEQKKIKSVSKHQTTIVRLTRNFGSYNSFLAGMVHAKGDVNAYLHADLQDPPELIEEMFRHYLNGYKFVIANRMDREDKSSFSNFYHWLVKTFAINNIPKGGFDLILFDKSIKAEIVKIGEKNTNNVYLMSWLGFPYINIPYKREKRVYGKSQWTFGNKVKLLVDTVFSFTKIPLWTTRIIFVASVLMSISNLIHTLTSSASYSLTQIIKNQEATCVFLAFLITVEYLDRIHESVRKRPAFVVNSIE